MRKTTMLFQSGHPVDPKVLSVMLTKWTELAETIARRLESELVPGEKLEWVLAIKCDSSLDATVVRVRSQPLSPVSHGLWGRNFGADYHPVNIVVGRVESIHISADGMVGFGNQKVDPIPQILQQLQQKYP